MDLGQIDLAIEQGTFATEPALKAFIAALQGSGGTAHLAGLVSPGGVHAHSAHMIEAAREIAAEGVPVVIHVITDGRDATGSAKATILTEVRVLSGSTYGVILVGTTAGVRALLVDGTGAIKPAQSSL